MLADLAYMVVCSGSIGMQNAPEGRLAMIERNVERIHPKRHGKIAQENIRVLVGPAARHMGIAVERYPAPAHVFRHTGRTPTWPGTHGAAPRNDRAESRASAKARRLFRTLSFQACKTFNLAQNAALAVRLTTAYLRPTPDPGRASSLTRSHGAARDRSGPIQSRRAKRYSSTRPATAMGRGSQQIWAGMRKIPLLDAR